VTAPVSYPTAKVSTMSDTKMNAEEDPRACIRCGTSRPQVEMTKVGSGWACHVGGGTTCAMQMIFRGYGHD